MYRTLFLSGLMAALLAGCSAMSLDPLSHRIREGQKVGEVSNLTPSAFPPGMTRADAEALLRRSGYSLVASTGRGQKPDTEGADHYQRSFTEFPCVYDYNIYVHYDFWGAVARAEGTVTTPVCT